MNRTVDKFSLFIINFRYWFWWTELLVHREWFCTGNAKWAQVNADFPADLIWDVNGLWEKYSGEALSRYCKFWQANLFWYRILSVFPVGTLKLPATLSILKHDCRLLYRTISSVSRRKMYGPLCSAKNTVTTQETLLYEIVRTSQCLTIGIAVMIDTIALLHWSLPWSDLTTWNFFLWSLKKDLIYVRHYLMTCQN